MCSKKLLTLLVVLLVVCSCVWALPGAKKTNQVTTAESTQQTQELTSPDSLDLSQKKTTETSRDSKSTEIASTVQPEKKVAETEKESQNSLASLEESYKTAVTTDKLNELLTLVEKSNLILGAEKIDTVSKGLTDISQDLEMNSALIAAQSSQIESLKKELKATRFFMDAGVAFGFKENGLNYGVVGDMGIKFGAGFLTKVGVQYMLGDLSDIKSLKWNLENMTVSATIGWEW